MDLFSIVETRNKLHGEDITRKKMKYILFSKNLKVEGGQGEKAKKNIRLP